MIKFGNYKKPKFKYSLDLNPTENYRGYGALRAVMDSSGEVYLVDPPDPLMHKIESFSFTGLNILSDKIQSSDKYNVLIFKSKREVIDFIKSHKSLHKSDLYYINNQYELIDKSQYRLIVEN